MAGREDCMQMSVTRLLSLNVITHAAPLKSPEIVFLSVSS